jgi:hypothetical protein
LRELARHEEAGFVTTTRRGNARLVHALADSVAYKPLADLLAGRWPRATQALHEDVDGTHHSEHRLGT